MTKSQAWTSVHHRTAAQAQTAYDSRSGTYEVLLSLTPAAITLTIAAALLVLI